MKIAIIGANGFVGSRLFRYFTPKYFVTPITRQTVDLLDYYQLQSYLINHKFDCVILSASTMNNDSSDIRNNIGLITNLALNRDKFGKLINLASGAEYDRQRDINNFDETELLNSLPTDYYGLSQNLRSRICLSTPNFYNLRIFNCFGLDEIKTRIFPKFILAENEFTIYNDRYFDYFSIQDLGIVIDHYICNDKIYKDINCVYKEKYLISEVLAKFKEIHKISTLINVSNTVSNNYTGDGTKLANLHLDIAGLEYGLKNYFNVD